MLDILLFIELTHADLLSGIQISRGAFLVADQLRNHSDGSLSRNDTFRASLPSP